MNNLGIENIINVMKERLAIRNRFDFDRVNGLMDRSTFFKTVKNYYETKQKEVDAGFCAGWTHFHIDPYESGICDCLTPIERRVWSDIRDHRLPLFPQFPVGKYFVDFGNPEHCIAVECDGYQWHQDKEKDQRRDAELARLGWRVVRIPGWMCTLEPYEINGKPLWDKLTEIHCLLGMDFPYEFNPNFENEDQRMAYMESRGFD